MTSVMCAIMTSNLMLCVLFYYCYAECLTLSLIMLNAIMLSGVELEWNPAMCSSLVDSSIAFKY
jgi:hypothetical protein